MRAQIQGTHTSDSENLHCPHSPGPIHSSDIPDKINLVPCTGSQAGRKHLGMVLILQDEKQPKSLIENRETHIAKTGQHVTPSERAISHYGQFHESDAVVNDTGCLSEGCVRLISCAES